MATASSRVAIGLKRRYSPLDEGACRAFAHSERIGSRPCADEGVRPAAPRSGRHRPRDTQGCAGDRRRRPTRPRRRSSGAGLILRTAGSLAGSSFSFPAAAGRRSDRVPAGDEVRHRPLHHEHLPGGLDQLTATPTPGSCPRPSSSAPSPRTSNDSVKGQSKQGQQQPPPT